MLIDQTLSEPLSQSDPCALIMFTESEFLQTVVVQIKTLEDLLRKYQVNYRCTVSVGTAVCALQIVA